MERNEIVAIATQIAANCTTCSQVAERFNALVKEYGKDDAKLIQAQAKELVKQSKLSTKVQAGATIEYLSSARCVIDAFTNFVKNDPMGEFAKICVEMRCGGDVVEYIKKYASYYTIVADDVVILNKYAVYDEDGDRVAGAYEYKPKRVDNLIGCASALKIATNNAKRCALGAGLSDVSRFVPAENVIWPESK